MTEELTPAARAADERRARQLREREEDLTPAARDAEERAAEGESSGATEGRRQLTDAERAPAGERRGTGGGGISPERERAIRERAHVRASISGGVQAGKKYTARINYRFPVLVGFSKALSVVGYVFLVGGVILGILGTAMFLVERSFNIDSLIGIAGLVFGVAIAGTGVFFVVISELVGVAFWVEEHTHNTHVQVSALATTDHERGLGEQGSGG